MFWFHFAKETTGFCTDLRRFLHLTTGSLLDGFCEILLDLMLSIWGIDWSQILVQVGARPKAVSMLGFPGRRSIPCSYHPGGREERQKDSIRVTTGNTCQVNNTPPIQPSPSADAYEVRFAILAWLHRRVMLSSSSYIWRNPIISWTILHRSVSGIKVEPSLWRRWSSTGNIAQNPVHDPCRMPSTQSEITPKAVILTPPIDYCSLKLNFCFWM